MQDKSFEDMVLKGIVEGRADPEFRSLTIKWMELAGKYRYTYRHKFLGVPIIQLPGDIVAIQSLIFDVKPEVIVETGIARGGSLVMSATFLALLDIYAGDYGAASSKRKVIGIDRDIRLHTHNAIEGFPFKSYITMIEGDSNADWVVSEVNRCIDGAKSVMVFLDSNHTHAHVYQELVNYSKFVTIGSYIVVFDTSIEFDNPEIWADHRPWGRGNSPHTALSEFMAAEQGLGFTIDTMVADRVEMTVCHDGFLKRMA